MASWYSKELGDGVQAYGQTSEMQEVFFKLLTAKGAPLEMAMFSACDTRENMVTVYFSPAAEDAARVLGATPCEKPVLKGLSLSVGDQRCVERFFPGEKLER